MVSEIRRPTFFKATVPGRVAIKKNGREFRRKGAGGFTAPSQSFESWASDAAWSLRQASTRYAVNLPITVPVNVAMVFYYADRRHPDLSNAYQGLEDLMQELGILKNDKLIHSHDGSRIRIESGCKERVEITITPFED